MRKRDIIFAGMATGTFVGLLMAVITQIPLGNDSDGDKITIMYHGSTALLAVIGIPLMSAFSVKYGSKKLNCCEPSLKHLLPVAFLTCLPVLGAAGGAPDPSLEVFVATILIGMVFGTIWSLPYVLWAHFKKTDSTDNEDE